VDPETILSVFKDEEVGGEYARLGTLHIRSEMMVLPRVGVEPGDPEVVGLEPQVPASVKVTGKDLTESHFRESVPVINLHAAIVRVVNDESTHG
jgi:hypothetical protein